MYQPQKQIERMMRNEIVLPLCNCVGCGAPDQTGTCEYCGRSPHRAPVSSPSLFWIKTYGGASTP